MHGEVAAGARIPRPRRIDVNDVRHHGDGKIGKGAEAQSLCRKEPLEGRFRPRGQGEDGEADEAHKNHRAGKGAVLPVAPGEKIPAGDGEESGDEVDHVELARPGNANDVLHKKEGEGIAEAFPPRDHQFDDHHDAKEAVGPHELKGAQEGRAPRALGQGRFGYLGQGPEPDPGQGDQDQQAVTAEHGEGGGVVSELKFDERRDEGGGDEPQEDKALSGRV